jgi:DNA-binding transcriptional regulator YhcF (GntR family)
VARIALFAIVIVTVDHDSPTPAFEQLRIAIRRLVATGALPIGSQLPTVRQLAADLALAPGTVVRAFRELEMEGVIETRGRHGTRVKAAPRPPKRTEREQQIRDAAATYAAIAAELLIAPDVALDYACAALEATSPPS